MKTSAKFLLGLSTLFLVACSDESSIVDQASPETDNSVVFTKDFNGEPGLIRDHKNIEENLATIESLKVPTNVKDDVKKAYLNLDETLTSRSAQNAIFVYGVAKGTVAQSGAVSIRIPNPAIYQYGMFHGFASPFGLVQIHTEHSQYSNGVFEGKTFMSWDNAAILLEDRPGEFFQGRSRIVKGSGYARDVRGLINKVIFSDYAVGSPGDLFKGEGPSESDMNMSMIVYGWIHLESDVESDLLKK